MSVDKPGSVDDPGSADNARTTAGLRWGDAAPELELVNQHGRTVSLADLRGHDVIVYFFPKAFSPGCTEEVCAYRDNQDAFASAGYVVVGVSPDPTEQLAEFAGVNGVEHDLLSDPGSAAARRWGAYGDKVVNGQPQVGPTRSTFVVGADGLLRSVQHHVEPAAHVTALGQQRQT